jgi:hypothetical protein
LATSLGLPSIKASLDAAPTATLRREVLRIHPDHLPVMPVEVVEAPADRPRSTWEAALPGTPPCRPRRSGLAPRAASVPTFLIGAAVTELRSPQRLAELDWHKFRWDHASCREAFRFLPRVTAMTTPLRPYPIRTVARSLKRMSHLLEVAAGVN